ncbi:hypothetical protein [Polymorphospora rubra]|uniref:Uncharacterized protein n=1 Tax=Polymorphospora rubra TaxID=338584 RepID=A0A810N3Q5_9ACTN|nr:hypothetical protein [Polymorphospora rubra]BCJ68331.1 hypothetical protein Prubr_53520 [Polymorphospora rubra]
MSRTAELWRQGCVPAVSGHYRADGLAHVVDVDGAQLSYFRVRERFDVDALLAAHPENLAEIDETARLALPDGSGSLICGAGAHGSEGFFARVCGQEELVWVVFLLHGNPFERIGVSGSTATFSNNLDRSVDVDLRQPLFRTIGVTDGHPGQG